MTDQPDAAGASPSIDIGALSDDELLLLRKRIDEASARRDRVRAGCSAVCHTVIECTRALRRERESASLEQEDQQRLRAAIIQLEMLSDYFGRRMAELH